MDTQQLSVGEPNYSGRCPFEVDRAVMLHRWDDLTFLHWAYDPAEVASLLPEHLAVDTFDGKAWVGLVPFQMEVRFGRGPKLPWLSVFPETNVRTYVRAADGTTGVWFLSLDASRLPAVVGGRVSYNMPYYWSTMRIDRSELPTAIGYSCVRRWPGRRTVSSLIETQIGAPIASEDVTDFEHYLTARWRLYSNLAGRQMFAKAFHEPWALHRAEATRWDTALVEAAGLSVPDSDPIVHWSPGVAVRIGPPELLASELR